MKWLNRRTLTDRCIHTHTHPHAHAAVFDGLWLIPHTLTHTYKYKTMQPVPLSACRHWQRGHSRLTIDNRGQSESSAQWRACRWRVEGVKIKRRKAKEGKKEPLFLFYRQIREANVSVTPCRKGGFTSACRWGMSQSVHAYMSHSDEWKNCKKEGEGFNVKKIGWQGGRRGGGGF